MELPKEELMAVSSRRKFWVKGNSKPAIMYGFVVLTMGTKGCVTMSLMGYLKQAIMCGILVLTMGTKVCVTISLMTYLKQAIMCGIVVLSMKDKGLCYRVSHGIF